MKKLFFVLVAMAFSAFAFAYSPPPLSADHPVMQATHAVYHSVDMVAQVQPAIIKRQATVKALPRQHEPIRHKRHYQAITRLASYVPEVPYVTRCCGTKLA